MINKLGFPLHLSTLQSAEFEDNFKVLSNIFSENLKPNIIILPCLQEKSILSDGLKNFYYAASNLSYLKKCGFCNGVGRTSISM